MNNREKGIALVKKSFEVIVSIISISPIVLYPIVFLYCKNIEEISLKSVWNPTKLFLVTMCAVYLFFGICCKSIVKAAFGTAISMIMLLNFSLIEKAVRIIFPTSRYWHILTLIVLVMFYLAFFIRLKENTINQLNRLMIIVFGGLILFNIIPQIPKAIKLNMRNDIPVSADSEKRNFPNIYYLVFDEYSDLSFMEKYYNYDNMEFARFLENKGFNVSYSSMNEAYVTEICMTNILNLDYLYGMKMNGVPEGNDNILENRKNNKAFEILRKEGYSIIGIGLPEFYGLPRVEGGQTFEKATMQGKSFVELILEKTIFYPFYLVDSSNKLQVIQGSVKYLMNMDININQSKFVLFHIEPSHTPFVMDESGEAIPNEYAKEWKDKKYYKGTYIYTTKLMREIAEGIINKDPNCIIVMSSDHSARAAQSGYDNMFEEFDKCRIFNAVYYRGEKFDIEGLSGINTMRKLFNKLFDMQLDMIETYPFMPLEEYKKDEKA